MKMKQENHFFTEHQLLHQFFECHAEKAPGKTALVVGDQRLTYGQLNTHANQLANHLRLLGVRPETCVGILAERSPEAVIGILGILKKGGTYVPLDPKYPKELLAFMLRDAQIPILLTQEPLVKSLPDNMHMDNVKVVCLDSDWPSISKQYGENLLIDVPPANVAFVVYTSGSTGNPKGVMTTHANMCHYVQSLQEAIGITADDRYLHTASIAFSSSNRQMMLPFFQGSTIIMATSEERLAPLPLFKLIKSQEVTVIDLVPSHWRSCIKVLTQLEQVRRKDILENSLRIILSASEALLPDIPKDWRKKLNQKTRLVNMYGITETTGIITTYKIPDNYDEKLKIVPIGYPIRGMQAYILADDLQTVPPGDTGMLHIGGLHIARGYLNKPELTQEKFIPNPFNTKNKFRLYKAGDICRCNSDGIIEYIGRSDHQLKIRGIRIEPKEIELMLNQHPAIQESVVVAKEFKGDKRMVAYFIKNQNQPLTSTELRQFIRENLPEHMIPSYFVRLDALPLTPNSKIDRAALLKFNICIDGGFIESRTSVEKTLVDIWVEVLGISPVGIFSNFFELGGDSLLAQHMLSRIYDIFDVYFPMTTLMEKPTVAGLAEKIEKTLLKVQTNVDFEGNRDRGKI